jgi:hypothetical protein
MFAAFASSVPKAVPARADGLADPALRGTAGARPVEGGPPVHGLFERAIERLEEVVVQETQALRSRAAIDLRDFNNRKSQGLLELNRALRGLDGIANDKSALAGLSGLRTKLDANRAALKTHLEAVREVATVLADAIQDAESDGTYSPSIRSGGRGP